MEDFILKYWIQVGFAFLVGIITKLSHHTNNKIKSFNDKFETIEHGMQSNLRNTIIAIYNRYIEKGHMPLYEKENLEKTYKDYKKLGGNGLIDHLYEELLVLPIRERKK